MSSSLPPEFLMQGQNFTEQSATDFCTRNPPTGPTRREWILSLVLFSLTFMSTTFAGLIWAGADLDIASMVIVAMKRPSVLLLGLPFSFTFLAVLLAHELGHFFACRYYGIRCTPPYFIPLPVTFAGTLGAFIRIKAPFQHKRALFDVGIAGPLAGFAFVIPAMVIGIANSHLIPKDSLKGSYNFGEPLLFRWIGRLVLGYRPDSQDMVAHPIAMAAWFGLLATSLNLLPIWQLDGGHISYAAMGRIAQKKLSLIASVSLIAISFIAWPVPSYLVFGVLLLVLGARLRFYHPPTLQDDGEIGKARLWLALLALVILVITFTPVPISIY